MMRKASILAVVMCLIIPFAMIPLSVLAEEVERELFTLDKPTSIVFSIEWETEEPEFSLIAPDGRTFDSTTMSEDVIVLAFEQACMILIRDAMAGTWRLVYDKGANEFITISVDEYFEGFWITRFDVGEPEESLLPVAFMVEHDYNVRYSYTLSLALEAGGAEKVIHSGTANTNELVELQLSLREVNSYDQYLLKLEAVYEDAGGEYFDFAYSSPFAYTNESSLDAMGGLDLSVNKRTGSITVDWGAYLPYGAQDVLLTVHEAGLDEPAFIQSFERDQTSVHLPFAAYAEWTRIEARWRYNGMISEPVTRTIRPGEGFQFRLDIDEADDETIVTNSRFMSVHYKQASNHQIHFIVNDNSEQIHLNGDGEKWFELTEGYNMISYQYEDENGIRWYDDRELYVDATPPTLDIYEQFDGITTHLDRFVLTGETEPNVTLTVNGETVDLMSGGRFIAEISLEHGENTIVVVAADPAGNTSVMEGIIHRKEGSPVSAGDQDDAGVGNHANDVPASTGTDDGSNDGAGWITYLPLFISLGISLGLSTWAIVAWKHKQRKKIHPDVQQSQEEVL